MVVNQRLVALGIIGLMAVSPLAWGFHFPRKADRHEPQSYTPVSQILKDAPASTDNTNGNSGVKEIQSLEYHGTQPKNTAPVSLTAVQHRKVIRITPTFVVFPVIDHKSREKAFSDLPIVFSTAFANQLEQQIQKMGYRFEVLNPVYAYDTVREKGLESLYNRVVADYRQAGRPNAKDLTELADELSTKSRHVDWVVFAAAEFDTNHLTKPVGIGIPLKLIAGDEPTGPNYFVKGNVQIFSTRDGVPMLWNQTRESKVSGTDFTNFTTSVYDDSDSLMHFKRASNDVAVAMIAKIPETMYATHSNITVKILDKNPEAEAQEKNFQKILKY